MSSLVKVSGLPTVHVDRGQKICSICQKEYTHAWKLKNHVMKVHAGKGRFPCDQCEKTFIEQPMLVGHVKKVHKGQGPKCHKCGLRFTTDKGLLLHKDQHNPVDERCTWPGCNKRFKQTRYLNEHKGHCKFNPDREKFKCPKCIRTFFQRKQLNRHLKVEH